MKGPLRRIRSSRRPPDPSPQESQPTIVAPPAGAAGRTASRRARARGRRTDPRPASATAAGCGAACATCAASASSASATSAASPSTSIASRRRNDELVLGKLAALDAVDRELRAIERVLDERRDIIELREPGVAACPRCGALHGSDARFCPQCGTQFSGPLAMVEVGGARTAVAAPRRPDRSRRWRREASTPAPARWPATRRRRRSEPPSSRAQAADAAVPPAPSCTRRRRRRRRPPTSDPQQ